MTLDELYTDKGKIVTQIDIAQAQIQGFQKTLSELNSRIVECLNKEAQQKQPPKLEQA